MLTGGARAKGKSREEREADFRTEIADVICQTLLLAHHHGVDVERAIDDKWLARAR